MQELEQAGPLVVPTPESPDRKSVGPDGILRPNKEQFRINGALAACLGFSENGKQALEYIRSISLDSVHGPESTPHQLAHREGMRFMAMVIIERVNQGKEQS